MRGRRGCEVTIPPSLPPSSSRPPPRTPESLFAKSTVIVLQNLLDKLSKNPPKDNKVVLVSMAGCVHNAVRWALPSLGVKPIDITTENGKPALQFDYNSVTFTILKIPHPSTWWKFGGLAYDGLTSAIKVLGLVVSPALAAVLATLKVFFGNSA